MATPGRKLDEYERRMIVRLRGLGWSIRRIAAEVRVSTRTVQKYLSVA